MLTSKLPLLLHYKNSVDENEMLFVYLLAISTIDVSDGESEVLIDLVKKLKRNHTNCVSYKNEVKMVVVDWSKLLLEQMCVTTRP